MPIRREKASWEVFWIFAWGKKEWMAYLKDYPGQKRTKWVVGLWRLIWTRSLLMLWPLQDHGSVLAICNADCNHCASVHRQPFSARWRHPVLSPPYQWASLSQGPCLLPRFSLRLSLSDARLQEKARAGLTFKSIKSFVWSLHLF